MIPWEALRAFVTAKLFIIIAEIRISLEPQVGKRGLTIFTVWNCNFKIHYRYYGSTGTSKRSNKKIKYRYNKQCYASILIESWSGQKSNPDPDPSCFLLLSVSGINMKLFYKHKIFPSKEVNWKIDMFKK